MLSVEFWAGVLSLFVLLFVWLGLAFLFVWLIDELNRIVYLLCGNLRFYCLWLICVFGLIIVCFRSCFYCLGFVDADLFCLICLFSYLFGICVIVFLCKGLLFWLVSWWLFSWYIGGLLNVFGVLCWCHKICLWFIDLRLLSCCYCGICIALYLWFKLFRFWMVEFMFTFVLVDFMMFCCVMNLVFDLFGG